MRKYECKQCKEMCAVIMKLEDDLTPNACPLFQIVIPDWRRVHQERSSDAM